MDRKEAILRIKEHMKHHGIGKYPHLKLKEALDMAIAALSQPNEPLTLEQLREMGGQPVWVKVIGKTGISCDGWCEVEIREKDPFAYVWWPGSEVEGIAKIEDYGKTWACYAYQLAHIDRKAWEKPCNMCGGRTTLYQHTNTTKLFMNTFGKAATLVTECVACPPYAECCMKGISANSAFIKIHFHLTGKTMMVHILQIIADGLPELNSKEIKELIIFLHTMEKQKRLQSGEK